jgi:hypothetical protein
MGYQLELDSMVQFSGLIPNFEAGRQSWKMDETILLLVLRLSYQEGIQEAQVDEHGAVLVMSEEILSKYETLSQRLRPTFGRLKDILSEFRRRGIVTFEQFEEKETIIAIRPAIGIIMGGDFMERLVAFNEPGSKDTADDDHDDEVTETSIDTDEEDHANV